MWKRALLSRRDTDLNRPTMLCVADGTIRGTIVSTIGPITSLEEHQRSERFDNTHEVLKYTTFRTELGAVIVETADPSTGLKK